VLPAQAAQVTSSVEQQVKPAQTAKPAAGNVTKQGDTEDGGCACSGHGQCPRAVEPAEPAAQEGEFSGATARSSARLIWGHRHEVIASRCLRG
jgi:hypothetical protein